MIEKEDILVDGANVAYLEKTKDGKPMVENIIAVKRKLEEKGYDPIIIVDAGFRYDVDDPQQLEGLIDKGKIQQAPAGTDADYFLIKLAQEHRAKIVTNDQYDDYIENYPWIEKRRVPLMIVDGDIQFYQLSPARE